VSRLRTGLEEAREVSRCGSWEPGAWDAFIRRHSSFVQAEARRQLYRYRGRADQSDIDDACQEVYALLLRNGARVLRQFRGESSISTWLACVVRSICRQIADHERTVFLGDREIVSEPPTEDDLPPEGLGEAVGRLPSREQRLLRLFFQDGRKYREIARDLGISINSVGPLLSRAVSAVRRLLAAPIEPK
jgi:RNA polymerase sigma-70 factor (ECF subfamily)